MATQCGLEIGHDDPDLEDPPTEHRPDALHPGDASPGLRGRCEPGWAPDVPNQVRRRPRRALRAPMTDNDAVTRLDQLLCERGLAETRSRAQALVMAGRVRVDGRLVTKAGTSIPGVAVLEVERGPAFVSRGGDKLATALAAFEIDVSGLACLDVGASTGGFTDCLLQAGAAHVVALDVGRGQMHQRLLADDRVTLLEGVNARLLAPGDLPGPPASLAVVDVSFISLALVLPPVVGVLARPLSPAAARQAAIRGRARRCAPRRRA